MQFSQPRLYFDYNASAPFLKEVKDIFVRYLEGMGNPSSVHTHGRYLRKEVEKARQAILKGLQAPSHGLYFTSGATEANAIVLHSIAQHRMPVLISAIEHDSVRENASNATLLPVSKEGVIDLAALEAYLKSSPKNSAFVSIMAANNETGVLQPLHQISQLCVRYGALLHIDAAQAIGRMPFNLMEIAVDYVTLSAHKIGGPVGIGALVARKGAPLASLYKGGGQEEGYRAGTLNWLGIIAFARAFEDALAVEWGPIEVLRNHLEDTLQTHEPSVIIAGKGASRLPNTSCFSMPGVSSEAQVIAFDLEGISVSAGSACSSGKVKASHVLQAMGFKAETAGTFIRVSLCPQASAAGLETFIKSWKNIYARCTREKLL